MIALMILLLLCVAAPLLLGLALLLGTVWLMVAVTTVIFTAALRLLSNVEVTHE